MLFGYVGKIGWIDLTEGTIKTEELEVIKRDGVK